jgi:hypothetical protein
MSQSLLDDEVIRDYLLGDLTEEERDRVRVRLITDWDFFEAALTVEDELTDEYVFGILSEPERKKLEKLFGAVPQEYQNVELAKILAQFSSGMRATTGTAASTLWTFESFDVHGGLLKRISSFLKNLFSPTSSQKTPSREIALTREPALPPVAATTPQAIGRAVDERHDDSLAGRIIGVKPDTYRLFGREQIAELDPADILCLDMEEFGLEAALDWVRHVRQTELREPDIILPAIVIVGRTDNLSFEDAYHLKRKIVASGAVFHERHPSKSFEETLTQMTYDREDIYRGFARDHRGFFYPKDTPRSAGKAQIAETRPQGNVPQDFSVYEVPLNQLSAEDFAELVRRMDTADTSWDVD